MAEDKDLAKKIESDLMAKTVPATTAELKKKWLKIGAVLAIHGEPKVVLPGEGKVTDEQLTQYSREFIEKGEANITLEDGTKKLVSLGDIDAAIGRYNTSEPGPDYPMISDEIPTRKILQKTAQATARGAESQSGFGGMISNFLVGLMNWIAGMFKTYPPGQHAPSFWESVSAAAEPKVGNAVARELSKEAESDPTMARFLRQQASESLKVGDMIVSQSIMATREKVTGKKSGTSEGTTIDLKTITMEEAGVPTNREIRDQVSETIVREDKVYATVNEELKKMRDKKVGELGWFERQAAYLAGEIPSDEVLSGTAHKATQMIADTMADAVADPEAKSKSGKKLAALSRDEFAKEMADRLLEKAKTDHVKLGIDETMFEKDPKTQKAPIESLRPGVESAIARQHPKLSQAMQAVALNENQRIAAAAKTEPSATATPQSPAGMVPANTPTVATNTQQQSAPR